MAHIYNVDRLVGTLVSACAIAFSTYFCYVIVCKASPKPDRKHSKNSEDAYHRTRYNAAERREEFVWHQGTCHCLRVQFSIFAPRVVHAVDVPSKLRFPRLTICSEDFQLLCDESHFSLYTVESSEGGIVGGFSFCRFCGMQILYAPLLQPKELQINLDCLNTDTITEMHIAYHSSSEPLPASQPPRYMYGDIPQGIHAAAPHHVHSSTCSSAVPLSGFNTTPNTPFNSPVRPVHDEAYGSPPPPRQIHHPFAHIQEGSLGGSFSQGTEDLYPFAFGMGHHPRNGGEGYKYSIDGDCDTMSSSDCFDSQLDGQTSRPRQSSLGSPLYGDSALSSGRSDKLYSSHLAEVVSTTVNAEMNVDVGSHYLKLKKFMKKHV